MKIIGLVAEYNPFHLGHLYHIQKSREALGSDCAVVCVMSGDFVQRGEAAIFSKHCRAQAAVRGGADLVLELPLPWSLSSAEGFARGAVGLLNSLNCVDYLSFGSECGDLEILNALAIALMDPALDEKIKEELQGGISYAQARQNALHRDIGELANHLEAPNNILAVEYLKAIYQGHLRLEPFTITREGTGHDQEGCSASHVRTLMKTRKSYSKLLPKESKKVFVREAKLGRGPVTMEALEDAIISRLRMLDESVFNGLPDAAEGLGNRLHAACALETTIDAIASAAKTKRYALSRIRRMCMCAALGIKAGQADETPPYARVLAANEIGRRALKLMNEKSDIPIITKPAAVNDLPANCKELFQQESAAHDLYVMGYSANAERRGGGDYRVSPFIM